MKIQLSETEAKNILSKLFACDPRNMDVIGCIEVEIIHSNQNDPHVAERQELQELKTKLGLRDRDISFVKETCLGLPLKKINAIKEVRQHFASMSLYDAKCLVDKIYQIYNIPV